MKASELRIGNLIRDSSNSNELGVIEAIFGIDVLLKDIQVNETWQPLIEKCNGIPLTEEWLLKFGFEITYEYGIPKAHLKLKIKGSNENAIDASPIKFQGDKYWACATVNKYWASNNIEHVHQLQNLFFALTSEELEIKK